jgi:uncharacterized protein (PEP-CTERM system associated)
MTRGNTRIRLRPLALAALALMGTQAVPALAAEWHFTPELQLRETYSDNYNLAPSGLEQSGFITEIAPGFTLTGKGRRSQFHANYQLRSVNYGGSAGHNNFQNYLNADGKAELMDDFMFIDGNANINNVSTSAFGPQALSSSYATNNRTEVRSYSISPYIRKRLDSLAQGELRYTHQGMTSDTVGFADYVSDRLNANLSSGEAYHTLGWDLAGSTQESRYTDLNSVRSDYVNGTLRYRLTDTFSLTGSTGYERYTYPNLGDAASGASWSVGFDWRPSERTALAATGGQRFYGNAYTLNGTHRSRYTTWNINYNEDITTQQEQFANSGSVSTSTFLNDAFLVSIPDAVARQQAVDAFIRATNLPATLATGNLGLSNRFFLQKRLQGSVAYTAGKSTALVSAYDTLRRPRTSNDQNSGFVNGNLFFSDQTRQRGVSGLYSLRLSPLSTMNLNAQYYRTASLLTNISDNNKLMTVGVSHQFSPHTSGTVELRRYQGTFTQSGTDFRENAISAYLFMRL